MLSFPKEFWVRSPRDIQQEEHIMSTSLIVIGKMKMLLRRLP